VKSRHPVEPARGGQEPGSRDFVSLKKYWIPAFAGMTKNTRFGLFMSPSNAIAPIGAGEVCKSDYTISVDAAGGQWPRSNFFVEKRENTC
jgi:hypothetical protein